MVDQKEKVSPKAVKDNLKAENENLQRIIDKGTKANSALEAKVKELTKKLEAAGGDVFDDSDYENCSWFIDTNGRKHPATDKLRRLARHRDLRPCSAPASGDA